MSENLIELSLNTTELRNHAKYFGHFFKPKDSRIHLAGRRAVNRTVKQVQTHISSEIRKTYYVKKQDFDKAIDVTLASKSAMRGSLAFKYRSSLPLVNFDATQNTSFVSVRVLKANRRRQIMPGGNRKIVATSNKRAAVWIAKNQVFARVEDKKYPVILWGPSLMAFFKEPSRIQSITKTSKDMLFKNIDREMGKVLAGFGIKKPGAKS